MDIDVALTEMRNAVLEGDIDTMTDRFLAIDEWLSKGGFYPNACNNTVQRRAF